MGNDIKASCNLILSVYISTHMNLTIKFRISKFVCFSTTEAVFIILYIVRLCHLVSLRYTTKVYNYTHIHIWKHSGIKINVVFTNISKIIILKRTKKPEEKDGKKKVWWWETRLRGSAWDRSRKGEEMNRSGIIGRLENQIKFKCEKWWEFISKF